MVNKIDEQVPASLPEVVADSGRPQDSAGPNARAWRTIKRLVLPVGAAAWLLLKFAAKLKVVLLLLPKVKFIGTALTMVISIGAYALLFPFWFAVGFVALIWVHEMGHVLQLQREGLRASAPMFIPFLGAFVTMKDLPKNAAVEARVGLAGPILGTVGALAVYGLYTATGQPLYLGLAYTGFFLNLFNLLPVLPLDGGRATAALSPMFWILGVALAVAMLIRFPNPILILILIMGGLELWRRWKERNSEDGQRYFEVPPGVRLQIGAVYFGLAVILVLLMSQTYIADPTTLIR